MHARPLRRDRTYRRRGPRAREKIRQNTGSFTFRRAPVRLLAQRAARSPAPRFSPGCCGRTCCRKSADRAPEWGQAANTRDLMGLGFVAWCFVWAAGLARGLIMKGLLHPTTLELLGSFRFRAGPGPGRSGLTAGEFCG